MSAKTSSTLGFERRFNPMLAEMTVDAVREARERRPRAEAADDGAHRRAQPRAAARRGAAPRARSAQPAADAQVLDVRDGARFADGHMAGLVQRLRRRAGLRQPLRVRARPRARGRDRRRDARAGRGRRAQARRGRLHAARRGRLRRRLARTRYERFEPIGLVEMGALADKGELQVVDVREASEQTRARGRRAGGALPAARRGRSLGARSRAAHGGRLPHRHALAARPPRCWRAAASRTCGRCSARA